MKDYLVDMHMHSCLSPCGRDEMLPDAIVNRAIETGLSVLAVTDHNASENCRAVINAAADTHLMVVPGMEVTTQDESHTITLFETLDAVEDFQKLIDEHLPRRGFGIFFGEQHRISREGLITLDTRFLCGAVDLNVNKVIEEVHARGGLAIASHIDRNLHSILKQLGMITPDMGYDAVEVRFLENFEDIQSRVHCRVPVVQNSDAHLLAQIGARPSTFRMKELSFNEIRLALRHEEGREVVKPGLWFEGSESQDIFSAKSN
jgi:PHP family Zn ribbon phosphoesterase